MLKLLILEIGGELLLSIAWLAASLLGRHVYR